MSSEPIDGISKVPNDRLSIADTLALDEPWCFMCGREVSASREDGPACWTIDPPTGDSSEWYLACERCKNMLEEDIERRREQQGETND